MQKAGILQYSLEDIADDQKLIAYVALEINWHGKEDIKFYVGSVPFKSEKDILNGGHDAFYVGEHSEKGKCEYAVMRGMKLYFEKLIEQMVRTKGSDKLFREESVPTTTYKDFKNAGELEKHIYDHYISVMTYANEGGDVKFLEDAKDNFTQFMAGYLVRSDITDLFKAIENGNKNLVEKYVKKIAAVSTEQYKAAAEFKKEIKEMTKPDSL